MKSSGNRVVLSSLVRRATVEPLKEYAKNCFLGQMRPNLRLSVERHCRGEEENHSAAGNETKTTQFPEKRSQEKTAATMNDKEAGNATADHRTKDTRGVNNRHLPQRVRQSEPAQGAPITQ